MNDTAERRKQRRLRRLPQGRSVDDGEEGQPEHFTTLASLSGKRVSVESGTTNRDFLIATSKKLVKQGKKAITIVTFPKDTDAFAALKAGRVDAYYADSPAGRVLREAEPDVVPGRRPPGQPVPDRDRHPQGRPAAGRDAEGDRLPCTRRGDEADRRQVGDDERVSCSRSSRERSARCWPRSTGTSSGNGSSTPTSVFARALWTTIYIAVVAQVIGVVLGLIAALMRMSRLRPLRCSPASTC